MTDRKRTRGDQNRLVTRRTPIESERTRPNADDTRPVDRRRNPAVLECAIRRDTLNQVERIIDHRRIGGRILTRLPHIKLNRPSSTSVRLSHQKTTAP